MSARALGIEWWGKGGRRTKKRRQGEGGGKEGRRRIKGYRYRWHVIDIWFFHHGSHCLFDISLAELVESVLIPDSFEVEDRST